MTKQEKLIKELQDRYEERIQEFESVDKGTIHILASLYVKLTDDLETYRVMWNQKMAQK